jgi:hypothetical protein
MGGLAVSAARSKMSAARVRVIRTTFSVRSMYDARHPGIQPSMCELELQNAAGWVVGQGSYILCRTHGSFDHPSVIHIGTATLISMSSFHYNCQCRTDFHGHVLLLV